MWLGRVRIAVAVLAAATTFVAVGAAVRSSGGTSPPAQLTPLALPTTSSTARSRIVSTSVDPHRRNMSIGELRAQWLDAENQIRTAGAAMGQQVQQAVMTKNGQAIAAALHQEVTTLSAQEQRIAALPWPAAIRPHIDAFGSSSTAAVNQLRIAASNPFGYDANQVNAAIGAFNAAANTLRRDLGLPPD